MALLIFSLLSGRIAWWDLAGFTVSPSGSYGVIVSLILIFIAVKTKNANQPLNIEPLGSTFGVILAFFSDWICHSYNLFQGPIIRGEIILFAFLFLIVPTRYLGKIIPVLAIFSVLLLISSFLRTASGNLIISDDHASFIYRFISLKENFPFIPYFSPLWNGGLDARDFFATGTLNVFLITSPLIYLFDVASVYNYIVLVSVFLVLPISIFLACRTLKLSLLSSSCAVILSLSANLLWYRWALKYGTLGFIVTAALVPLNVALLSKLLANTTDLSKKEAVLFVITFTLMLFWSPSGLIFIPSAVLALIQIRNLIKKRYFKKIVTTLLIVNVPWIIVFASVSKVSKFVDSSTSSYQSASTESTPQEPKPAAYKSKNVTPSFTLTLKTIRENAVSINPILLFLTLPGLFLFERTTKILLISTSIWLLTLGSLVSSMLPQLEFDRMLVILSVLGAIPAGFAVGTLLDRARTTSKYASVATALVSGFLVTGPFGAANVVNNRSIEQYTFATHLVTDLADVITKFADNGRVLFSGFTLHDMNGGHIAPLVFLSGQPLIASSPFHNLWRYRQVFPDSFIERKESNGIVDYLDLYNVSALFTNEKEWREYFANRPKQFTQVWHEDKFTLFQRVNFVSSYFLKGSADYVTQNSNSFTLIPKSEEVVVKLNYFPFLTASDCELSAEQVAPEVTFIRLSKCPIGKSVVIKSKDVISRLWNKGDK